MPVEPASPLAPAAGSRAAWRAAAAAVSVVSAVFCLAVGALLFVNQARVAQHDPLNAPGLAELRRQFAEAPRDESLKQAIRLEDFQARQLYFAGLERTGTGAWLLLGGALALLVSLAAWSLLQEVEPDIARLGPEQADWDRRRAAWRGLAAGVLVLLAAAALVAVLADRSLTPGARPIPAANPNPAPPTEP